MENGKLFRSHGGTVLMEFIVVFPIYLILFAGLFMIGDMAVRPIVLSSGDRTAAHDIAEAKVTFWGNWRQTVIYKLGVNSKAGLLNAGQDNVGQSSYAHYAAPSFKGPWSCGVGGQAHDDFTLFELTRGQLASTDALLGDAPRETVDNADFANLLANNPVRIYSKDSSKGRAYSYYTYKRVRYSEEDESKTYRAMYNAKYHNETPQEYAGRLVDDVATSASWNVLKPGENDEKSEKFANVKDDEKNERQGPPDNLQGREYNRYPELKTWSE